MIDNFIGVYKSAFSKEYCNRAIKYFDEMQKNGFTENRFESDGSLKTRKDDAALHSADEECLNLTASGSLFKEFNETFWGIYNNHYSQEFAVLKDSGHHSNYAFKIQKTKIGEGYHIWHYESVDRNCCHRLLTWMLYLNDVQEGGETEFLYQHKRVKPEAGTLVIWPAAFTHTHRGNPPLSNDKYVITGWVEF
jgi:hypothetical protein